MQNNDCKRKKRLQNNINTYVSQPLARWMGAETETMPKKPQNNGTVLTMREYSTLMMLQSRMEGETGGIFSILPLQVSVLPEDKDSPRRLATSCLTSFIFPLA